MHDLDNFLDSLDLDEVPVNGEVEETSEEPTPQEPQAQSLSDDDFNDILTGMGFEESSDDEEDEFSDEDEEEYDENIGEGRDLDAEEDADWNERIESGEISEVHFHMPNGEVVDVPVVHDAATDLANANTDEEVAQVIENHAEDFLIQPNSPTLLMDESTSRFSGTEWYEEIKKQRIILAGCGGIGSWTALQLARMTPASIFLYDDDVVEMANMSGQLYSNEDVGIAKVDAIARTIGKFTTAQNIYALNQRFTPDTEAGDVMICGFDNMTARKIFYESWVARVEKKSEEDKKKCLFIDGRLSIDTLQVLCIRGDDMFNIIKYGREYLFLDEEAEHTVCSMKQTTYLACMISSFIVNLFTNHCANLLNPIIPYDLPFFTEYDSQNMIFKTVN